MGNSLIFIGGLMVVIGLFTAALKYKSIPEPPKHMCTYEIKYLHVSGREITKRVYMTCQGFYHWYEDPQRYKVPTMVLPSSDGTEVLIQGATDIFSVAKIKTEKHEQQ